MPVACEEWQSFFNHNKKHRPSVIGPSFVHLDHRSVSGFFPSDVAHRLAHQFGKSTEAEGATRQIGRQRQPSPVHRSTRSTPAGRP